MISTRTGILLQLGALLLLSCSDAVAKILTDQVSIMQIALFQSVVMLLAVPLIGKNWRLRSFVQTDRPRLQLVRSLCQLGSALCFFAGLKLLPLAELVSIIFIGPLLITALSALVLRERVGARRWCACLVGFAGAMVVVRPGFDTTLGWPALFPVAAASFFSVYVICTRLTAPHERHATMMFYTSIASVCILGVSVPAYWVTPAASGWLGLLTVGVLSATSVGLTIKAFALAPASLLAPFTYVQIVTATLFGFLLFNELPDTYTVVGVAIIISSGLYVFHRERRADPVVP